MFLLYVAVRNQNYKKAETIALPSIEAIFKKYCRTAKCSITAEIIKS